MNISKRRFVVFAGVLLMVLGMSVGRSLFMAASPAYLTHKDRISVSVLPTASTDSMKLSAEEVQKAAETLDAPVIWWGNACNTIKAKKRAATADVYAVGGRFADFHPERMLYGSFLSSAKGASDAIILDSSLAWQLFGTVNALGMEVKINNKTYTVAGICAPDETLLGTLSRGSAAKAYIAYNSQNNIPVCGMEAALPKSIPGKSLKAVKGALSALGKTEADFLFKDISERALLDAEAAALPITLFVCIIAIFIAVFAKRVIFLIARALWNSIRENYLRDIWKSILWEIAKLLFVVAAAVGIIYTLFYINSFPFFLPARYIPASFIDMGFYKELAQTEAQAAIRALAYFPAQWEILHDAAARIANFMNMLSVMGIAVFGFGISMLKDARSAEKKHLAGWRSKTWDIPSIWISLALSMGISLFACSTLGLPFCPSAGMPVIVCFGTSFWAAKLLYKEDTSRLFGSRAKKMFRHTTKYFDSV